MAEHSGTRDPHSPQRFSCGRRAPFRGVRLSGVVVPQAATDICPRSVEERDRHVTASLGRAERALGSWRRGIERAGHVLEGAEGSATHG